MALMSFWNDKYRATSLMDRSWTQLTPGPSLRVIESLEIGFDQEIIDLGAGSARLIDDLLDVGYSKLTALDISQVALDELYERVGTKANYICESILEWVPTKKYKLAHDRAVFHFLIEPYEQQDYKNVLLSAVEKDGYLVMGTFGPTGPEQCSGLPVTRWSAESLIDFFTPDFGEVESLVEIHRTPWDSEQNFTWVVLKRSE